MFDFGNANDAQKQAIETTDGPVLITAGPGTGKTFTLGAAYNLSHSGEGCPARGDHAGNLYGKGCKGTYYSYH